jgi:hypothetical protein
VAYAQTPYRPAIERPAASSDERAVAKWMLGFIAFLALALAFGALQLYQASSEGAATASLGRATAALTEIDTLLDRHYEEMQQEADAAQPGETVELEGYPIAIGLTKEDVLGVPKEELRAAILGRSAARLYADGTGVLREAAEAKGPGGVFSVAGLTDRMLGQLTNENHTRAGVAAVALFGVAAALCAATAAACRGWGRLAALGVILAAAGGATLIGGLAMLGYAGAQSGEYVRVEFFGAIEDLAMLPVRNGAAVLAAGVAIAGAAFAGARISRT